jgi:hypothetical protein
MPPSIMQPTPELWSFEWWKGVCAMAQSVSVAVGMVVGLLGINAWRRQTIGKRKMELAEQVVGGVYQARDVFDWVRTRVIFRGEGASRPAMDGETERQKRQRDLYFVPIERLHNEKELFARLQAQRYLFTSYFGKDSAKAFELLDHVRLQITHAASVLIEMTGEDANEPNEKLRNILGWGPRERPDELDQKIADAVTMIEKVCQQILEGPR